MVNDPNVIKLVNQLLKRSEFSLVSSYPTSADLSINDYWYRICSGDNGVMCDLSLTGGANVESLLKKIDECDEYVKKRKSVGDINSHIFIEYEKLVSLLMPFKKSTLTIAHRYNI